MQYCFVADHDGICNLYYEIVTGVNQVMIYDTIVNGILLNWESIIFHVFICVLN